MTLTSVASTYNSFAVLSNEDHSVMPTSPSSAVQMSPALVAKTKIARDYNSVCHKAARPQSTASVDTSSTEDYDPLSRVDTPPLTPPSPGNLTLSMRNQFSGIKGVVGQDGKIQGDYSEANSTSVKVSSLKARVLPDGEKSATYPPLPCAKHQMYNPEEDLEEAPLFVLLTTYFGYFVLLLFGHTRDFFGKIFRYRKYSHMMQSDGYAPLTSDFESFYTRRLYTRIRDCWNRPITDVPGRTLTLLERESNDFNKTFKLLGTKREVLNLSSYNYLGFAQSEGLCADMVEDAVNVYGVGLSSSRMDLGTSDQHQKLEKLVARFLGKEDSMVISMGFATNSTTLPALVEKGSLIISDELNHSSLVFGARLSGAAIRIFKHNDIKDLERLLRDAISQGQPRTHRPWKKILIVVEGLYSMEGSIVNLPEIVELKKKYKCYLYVDEAHSIGAVGPRGGGVCDYFGVDPADIDILMGTFTKSFGAAGGYIAASKAIVNHLKLKNHGSIYAEPMAPPVAEQVYASMKLILGEDGSDNGQQRLKRIADNSVYFRRELKKMGFIVYGHEDSPVIPMLLFNPGKIPAFSRECLKRGVAVVVVGYPATPIITSRARFCMSAAHDRQDLDFALKVISEVGDLLQLKQGKLHLNGTH
ncbi:hypothetical protein MP228_013117 [Amoeboaphelidium protococcarum]|nr:hypothetical protein MP228_013117 [Amoeboaphelidium protococcarum]